MSYKYRSLAKYLMESDQDMLRMTFDEIEKYIEGKLPSSALEHRAWWSNSTTHSHARHGWLNAGYETAQVDLDKRQLTFVRQSAPLQYLEYSQDFKFVKPSPRRMRISPQDKIAEIVLTAGGVDNLQIITGAISQYIAGDLLETELGQILRKHWPRGS